MTQEFAEVVNRLARAKNFEEGSYLLITFEPENTQVVSEFKGNHAPLISGMGGCLQRILPYLDDEEAKCVKEVFLNIFKDDEKHRFEIKTLA